MNIGDAFPDFALISENGEILDSKSLEGIRYVLYICPGSEDASVKAAEEFTASYAKFALRNIPIFGVGGNTPEYYGKIKRDRSVKICLLSDPEDVFFCKLNTEMTENTIPATYIVGKNGKIEAEWIDSEISGHADGVLRKAITLCRSQ